MTTALTITEVEERKWPTTVIKRQKLPSTVIPVKRDQNGSHKWLYSWTNDPTCLTFLDGGSTVCIPIFFPDNDCPYLRNYSLQPFRDDVRTSGEVDQLYFDGIYFDGNDLLLKCHCCSFTCNINSKHDKMKFPTIIHDQSCIYAANPFQQFPTSKPNTTNILPFASVPRKHNLHVPMDTAFKGLKENQNKIHPSKTLLDKNLDETFKSKKINNTASIFENDDKKLLETSLSKIVGDNECKENGCIRCKKNESSVACVKCRRDVLCDKCIACIDFCPSCNTKFVCVRCKLKAPDTIYDPCNHVTCQSCSPEVDFCPYCDTKVEWIRNILAI